MKSFRGIAGLAGVAVIAVGLMASGAVAEPLNSAEWKFSATFPCRSEVSSKPVKTDVGNVTLVAYTCANDKQAFFVGIADYPKGTITSSTQSLDGAIHGVAKRVNGTIRSNVPYTFGNLTGLDALIDGPSSGAAANASRSVLHARIFIIGDRLYQVFYQGPAGTEKSSIALRFLDSFALKH
jgi:hypothetical protein